MIFTPTPIDVRPAKLTRANALISSPTWIGSLKSTLSTDTVTQGRPARRMAHPAATRSTSDRMTPPNTFPRRLAGRGISSSDLTASASRQGAYLRLEQVAQRIHGRRVVGVPGEVAEQAFALVPGAERQSTVLGRQVEQHDHALPRHHVAAARGIGIAHLREIAVYGGGDVHGDRLNPQLVYDQLGMLQALRGRRLVRHPHTDHVFFAERLDREEGGQ